MTRPDYKALCAELADNLELILVHFSSEECGTSDSEDLIARARAALALPAGCDYPGCVDDSPDERCSRWLTGECPGPGARAALAEGETGPSYEDLIRLATTSGIEEWWAEEDGNGWTEYSGKAVSVLAFARAVLARWGSTPRPIPVAERLPGAEDCDPSGQC